MVALYVQVSAVSVRDNEAPGGAQHRTQRTSAVFVESSTPVIPGEYTPDSSAHAPVIVMSFVFTLWRSWALPQPPFSVGRMSQTPMRLQADAVMTRGFGLEGSGPGAKHMEWMVSLWKAARMAEGARVPSLLRGAVCDACDGSGSNTNKLPFSSPAHRQALCHRGCCTTGKVEEKALPEKTNS